MATQEFGARLRELRKQAGLSQRELADKLGINFTYLSKIESGVMPPPSEKVILRLAEVLNADRDELMTLAGKIPADIAQILKNREVLQSLRASRTQTKVRAASKKEGVGHRMKNLVNYKGLSRVAIPIVLVLAVAASLWFASPAPVNALQISFPSLPSGTIGSTHSFRVKIDLPNPDVVPIQSIDMEIYNINDSSKKMTCTGLPLNNGGTGSYSGAGGTISLTASATNWQYFSGSGYADWKGTGYSFSPPNVYGYGYQAAGTASIEYTGTWTSPSGWPEGGYKIKVTINTLPAISPPGSTQAFAELSSQFTLSALPLPPMGGGIIPDTTPPVISDTSVSNINKTSADISWTTNEPSTSQVEYWSSPSLFSPLDETRVTDHLVHLTDLTPATTYYYKTMSKDAAGNLRVSDEYTFTTPGAPAAFSTSDLTISPTEVEVGKSVALHVLVTNTGDISGSYKVTLKINNVTVATKDVTLAGGAGQTVTFTTSQDVAGTYTVSVDGLSGTFMVKAPAAPPALPAPAAFTTSALSISPSEVNVGESVTISARVTNTGDLTGSYEVTLKINNVAVATKDVTLASGAGQTVTFTTSQDIAGTYTVNVDGLSGTFTVKVVEVPSVGPAWWVWLIVGLAAAAVIAAIVWLVVRRRKFEYK